MGLRRRVRITPRDLPLILDLGAPNVNNPAGGWPGGRIGSNGLDLCGVQCEITPVAGKGAEFVTIDRDGNLYGGEPRPRRLQKYVRVRP